MRPVQQKTSALNEENRMNMQHKRCRAGLRELWRAGAWTSSRACIDLRTVRCRKRDYWKALCASRGRKVQIQRIEILGAPPEGASRRFVQREEKVPSNPTAASWWQNGGEPLRREEQRSAILGSRAGKDRAPKNHRRNPTAPTMRTEKLKDKNTYLLRDWTR